MIRTQTQQQIGVDQLALVPHAFERIESDADGRYVSYDRGRS